ncbi:MAG: glucose-6-phosphate isomerase [Puniceicoccales bacterium]|jgi:glucose-6-phosphate isomerase|nr:glucose-6-phosphate isomerase [Puniceicoccales bacterium]
MAGWEKMQRRTLWWDDLGFGLDTGDLVPDGWEENWGKMAQAALLAMERLESGAVANGTEQRRVGHYWLRAPELAPTEEIRLAIETTTARLRRFTAAIHGGKIMANGKKFSHLICVGIGGSVLGTQLFHGALAPANPPLIPFFMDNTDPEGMVRVLASIGKNLGTTLVIVASKSGTTPEPCNALQVIRQAMERDGLNLAERAVAITCSSSALDRQAEEEKWLERFPMWDWVGGRNSALSAVGLLPAALMGIDTESLLAGAAAMDRLGRSTGGRNPSLQLALAWYAATGGRGERAMVTIPYRDSLARFSPYLQQIVMESIGKRLDRNGKTVHQGLTVYGNRGSTDQHSYVQQLRDGPNNFFVNFIEVLRSPADGLNAATATAVAYLEGFYLGTRAALEEAGRPTLTVTLLELTPFSLGMLMALYERAVGIYGEFVNVNAYDQPGVEAGKRAADRFLRLKNDVETFLASAGKTAEEASAAAVAEALGRPEEEEMVYKWLAFLRAHS